jgi:hypothetical protein
MKYLAIGFFNDGQGETFSGSIETDQTEKSRIMDLLMLEFDMSSQDIDTILLVENGNALPGGGDCQHMAPNIKSCWSAAKGDFR